MHSMQNLEYQQCRTCYDSKSNLILLTSLADTCASQAAVDKSYAQLLLEVCNINIMDDKPLGRWPHFICLNCSHKLKIAYDFIQKTQQIDQLLQSIAKELENKGEPNFIEKPALDIPLEIKTEKEDVEIDSNDREFQYSPDPVDVVKAELNSTTGGKHEQSLYNNNSSKTNKKNTKKKLALNNSYDNSKSKETNAAITNDISFACDECDKTFSLKWMLNTHKRYTHLSEEKKMRCHICGQAFARPFSFGRHMQDVHKNKTEIKSKKSKTIVIEKSKTKKQNVDVTCDVCDKTFLNRQGLVRHKRYVHVSEDQKIPCTICGLKIARADHFRMHMKRKHNTHVSLRNKPEYPCDKCARSYSRRSSLFKHIKEMHSK